MLPPRCCPSQGRAFEGFQGWVWTRVGALRPAQVPSSQAAVALGLSQQVPAHAHSLWVDPLLWLPRGLALPLSREAWMQGRTEARQEGKERAV